MHFSKPTKTSKILSKIARDFTDRTMDSAQKLSQYRELRCIYKGEGRAAFLCHHLRDDSLVILKKIWIRSVTPQEREEAVREAEILKLLNHPNIIRFRDFFVAKEYLCLVMDYAEGGDLYQRIHSSDVSIPEAQILDWTTQLLLALKHIHDRKIIHRDIKSSNIFLTSMSILKLGDFGISASILHTNDFLSSFAGTYLYLAPEILCGVPYNAKADVWSLGVVVYEMCALKLPFFVEKNDRRTLEDRIKKGKYIELSKSYSEGLRSLVREMLTVEPDRRPSVTELLSREVIRERVKGFLDEGVREKSPKAIHSNSDSKNYFEAQKHNIVASAPEVLEPEMRGDSPQPRRKKEPSPPVRPKKQYKILSDDKANGAMREASLIQEAVIRRNERVPPSKQPPACGNQTRPTPPPNCRESMEEDGSRDKRKKFFEKIEFLKKELSQPECFRDSANFAKEQLKKIGSLDLSDLNIAKSPQKKPMYDVSPLCKAPAEKDRSEFVEMVQIYKNMVTDSEDKQNKPDSCEKIKSIYKKIASKNKNDKPILKFDEVCEALINPQPNISDAQIAQFILSNVFMDQQS